VLYISANEMAKIYEADGINHTVSVWNRHKYSRFHGIKP